VDGSVVYRDKTVGVEKPQEFVQEPFGAVMNETGEVGNIITVKDTRTPTNSESMRMLNDIALLTPEPQESGFAKTCFPTQARMSSSGRC
jgi:hypothetical protein